MCDLLLWSVVGHRLWQLAFWFPMLMSWGRETFVAIGELIWTACPSNVLWVVYYTLTVNRDIIASENLTRYLRASPQSHIVTGHIHFPPTPRSVELTNCDLLTVSRLHIRMQVVTWCQLQPAPYLVIGSPLVAVIGVSGGNGELLQVEIWSNLIRSLRLWSESGQVVTWCQFQSPQSWSSVEVLWSTSGCHHSWSSCRWCESW